MKKWLLAILALIVVAIGCYAFSDYQVAYNQKSGIYHSIGCEWARKCTVNCIYIMKSKAIQRGGRACKVCGG